MTSPVVVPAPELDARFDPRTGTTGNWLGGDVARDVPLGDAAGRVVWLFGDSYWRTGGTGVPTTRSGAGFMNDSLAIQTGPDLATADLTFHRGPGGNWFTIPGGTHVAWPLDGIVLGDDLYVLSMRVLASSPFGGDHGWCVHRVPDARNLPVTSWAPTLLHQSADTNVRPLFSCYDDGDGYVHGFTIESGVGWHWHRWTTADFTGSGTQGAVEWWTGSAWSTDPGAALLVYDNHAAAEGSVHRRESDGRWVLTDSGVDYPYLRAQVRLAAEDADGSCPAAPAGGYLPPPPHLQVDDWVRDGLGLPAVVRAVNPDGTRVVEYPSVIATGLYTQQVSGLTPMAKSGRFVYESPRSHRDAPAEYSAYSYKAHPAMTGAGLVISYVDNATSYPDLSMYWPKFVRVLPPTVSGLAVTPAGLASWTAGGAPDRLRIRHGDGGWVEVAATATGHQLTGYAAGQSVEVLAIGIGGEAWQAVGGTRRSGS